MNEENKCLKCGNELDILDYTDLEIDDGTTVIATVNGVCVLFATQNIIGTKNSNTLKLMD